VARDFKRYARDRSKQSTRDSFFRLLLVSLEKANELERLIKSNTRQAPGFPNRKCVVNRIRRERRRVHAECRTGQVDLRISRDCIPPDIWKLIGSSTTITANRLPSDKQNLIGAISDRCTTVRLLSLLNQKARSFPKTFRKHPTLKTGNGSRKELVRKSKRNKNKRNGIVLRERPT